MKLYEHLIYLINKMKKLESDKHSGPHFSCAANKLNHFLEKILDMGKLMVIKDSEEPESLNN
jgi:hypothetical protein